MAAEENKELYFYDPNELSLRLDQSIEVLKEFRESLPRELGEGGKVTRAEVGYLQAILNIIDYIEVPSYINDEASAEA